MGKKVIVRKSGSSMVITMPSDIAEMYGIKKGSEVEYEPFTISSFQLKVVRSNA